MERQRRIFLTALAFFSAWTVGLAVMAYTSAERPRPAAMASPAEVTPPR